MRRKVKEPKVALTPEQRKIRRQARAEDRVSRPKRELPVDFDWSTIAIGEDRSPRLYVHRCSTKCERASENPPLTPSGNGMMGQFKTDKGKLRWMFSFKKRSERDAMLRESKILNSRKAKKEDKRESTSA